MRKVTAFVLSCFLLFFSLCVPAAGQEPDIAVASDMIVQAEQAREANAESAESGPGIQAPSAVLMEASTGQVIFEKNADEKKSPASITKIMTLILIFDALDSGKIKLTDEVVTSAHAKSMGGSQVFLEEGEIQTVETLIKCIVVASGNDASVAMAEYIAGTEDEFVKMMNERAAALGMTNTNFEDCCGLTESPTHVTTARDIAIMSRELINKYPQIHNYSTIWMENITHVTKQGTKEFGLSNTNKLLKMATNFKVTGLKTGSTSIAKYCLSATAEKDGVRLIASIMAAPDYKARFADAQTLLNYGYANCKLYEDKEMLPLPDMVVDNGVEEVVPLKYGGSFSYLSLKGEDFTAIEKTLDLVPSLPAPVEEGQPAGNLVYTLSGKKIGEVPVYTAGAVREAKFLDYLKRLLRAFNL
ncbi:D-alanyl-D-alanine carboxypeptidase family protein [Lacrimispora sp.]|uniref:D-alanyl-D-alanine carboxypeptidase family protein n=1 Tax=Lacrimispora sp. TaxID=2719234 RepID=UPI0039940129